MTTIVATVGVKQSSNMNSNINEVVTRKVLTIMLLIFIG